MPSNNLHERLYDQQHFYERINEHIPVCVADRLQDSSPSNCFQFLVEFSVFEYWQNLCLILTNRTLTTVMSFHFHYYNIS